MVDLMDDEPLKQGVISHMLGELDDLTAGSLKKPKGGPVKGVEIAITVSPKSEEEAIEGEPDGDEGSECMEPGCEDPMHDHTARDAAASAGEPDDYISQLLKKLG